LFVTTVKRAARFCAASSYVGGVLLCVWVPWLSMHFPTLGELKFCNIAL